MILSLIGFALAVGPNVVEVPDPASKKVVLEAFVRAPKEMSDREQAGWNVLADALYDGTEEFSRDRLIQYASQTGEPLLIEAMPDYIRIQVVEPPDGINVAGQIVEAICRRASLTDEALTDSIRRLKKRQTSTWMEALLDLDLPYDRVTGDTVRSLYSVAFRPENTTLVFGGTVEPGQGGKIASDRFPPLTERPLQRVRYDRAPRQRVRHLSPVTTYELRCKPLQMGKAEGAAGFLATFALGAGKEGAMHRIVREQLGLSYRQEAVIWPSQDGWTPRLIFAKAGGDILLGGTVRDALMKDVETWTPSVLTRALAMAKSSFAGENPVSPVWGGTGGPMGSSLEDRCTWAGLAVMVSGTPLSTETMNAVFQSVTLDELKAAATKMLDEASISVIPGS